MIKQKHIMLLALWALFWPSISKGQTETPLPQQLTLEQCVEFALKNNPTIKQSLIDEEIGEREIKSSLSGWFPQISTTFGLDDNIKLRTQAIDGNLIAFGQKYNSSLLLQVNQTLFNRDQLFASKSADNIRTGLTKNIEEVKISTAVNVSKAYYDILLTYEQLNILNENLSRLQKQYNDARNRYESGLVDKTDYQRASISLSNVMSNRNRVKNSLNSKFFYLKQLMGFPQEQEFTLDYNYDLMEQQVFADTTETLSVENRVEYQFLENQVDLLNIQTNYEKWSYIPTLSAYYNYNWLFFNNDFSSLYEQSYPTSAVGLSLSLPIFQGGKRTQNIHIAELKEERSQIDLINLRSQINTEYEGALADYKSNYFEWQIIRENMEMASEVYDIIKLQYDEGIKAYVDLIVAETELRTAQLNHYNAIYQLLVSKLDLEKALGNIEIN
ncbi:outer membrane protein TolC [Roseivirga pacifica]|uniref:Outer membrane protein TolC n=1 Tax=Roseivirga pacifica TaxID=1267423 RepID=A0A1I0R859_9BACT|nr:TolC family protein [Roseivirga pacifica]RKQ49187.1 outer membrane protein TolC [Roseivirga pacifica]SEW36870.1 Outer membrane protein TolC [Roseivirga pacifica]